MFNQMCQMFGFDERTRAVTARLIAEGGGMNVRLAVARAGRSAGLGQQLVGR
ncbi:hypothetical protein [Curtobacterium sp. MCPF17_021]|uniref:hypothetical protein n=1 Tax=Curtobacterium sp. MCPF17_021 TaxID=2175639 RepID=UPI0015E87AA0|nr:hypothetical protein [Curtobacterium sp. MCPF17_021]WIE85099.1 hypothetical protein DEJ29_018245 [Curtobacterium sp. MCPF17_021]